VAVLVHDHLGVLGVVHATLAERDVRLVLTEERVVAAELVDAELDLALVDGRSLDRSRGSAGSPGRC
jgi:hypothetical protein